MQFKDAAYEILKQSGESLHYNEITERALEKGILTFSGKTPQATMGALLYTDTLKENSRFRRGDQRGTFALRIPPSSDIQQQINAINSNVRKSLRDRLLQMEPRKFENLVKSLLDEMGLEATSVTEYSGDGGIDVRGTLNAENLSKIDVAVQTKRWKGNVGPKIVRELRGSLKVHEHGIVITPSDFTPSAILDADEPGKTHISLINGEQLLDLLIEHQVGVAKAEHTVYVLDDEYWSEILGDHFISTGTKPLKPAQTNTTSHVNFPLPIQAKHKGIIHKAELLGVDGRVRYKGEIFETPSAAAKAITVEWKSVNGWDFWKYISPETGKAVKIGSLK